MIDKGVWYIRTAASDERHFVEMENWSRVLAEEEKIIGRLFFDP